VGVDLVLMRHGRTAWNREVRFRGRMDLPLDELGEAQARAAARSIRSRWPQATAIYTSPLRRACQTAAPIAAALGRPAQVHTGLLDIDYGQWTGLTPAEAADCDPERHALWQTAPQQVRFPGGEALSDVQQRLLHLLEELQTSHSDQTIVLVGHLVVNRVLLCTVLGLDLAAFWRLGQDNGAINWIHYEDNGSQILNLNDTCHLHETASQSLSEE
jgi:broad specificity phosphatase PhoE